MKRDLKMLYTFAKTITMKTHTQQVNTLMLLPEAIGIKNPSDSHRALS